MPSDRAGNVVFQQPSGEIMIDAFLTIDLLLDLIRDLLDKEDGAAERAARLLAKAGR